MNGPGLIVVMQNIAQMITGPFGISAIIIAVAGTALASAMHFIHGRAVFVAMGLGALAFSASWLVNTYLAA